jgi:hypothetical protein
MSQKKRKHKKGETYLSLAILLALAGIGTGIFLVQFSYNPANLHVSSTVPGAPEPTLSTGIHPNKPIVSLPESIAPLTPLEIFDSRNLYEKINGQAELYLSAGFLGLKSQRFVKGDDSDSWMELFVYDMGSILNAFAVFSAQRRDDGESIDLTQFSYKTKNAFFLVHGPYYVEFIAAVASNEILEVLEALARNLIRENPVNTEAITELALFPRPNLDENSISLLPSNAFGYERLNNVFTATYNLEGSEVTAFLSRRKDPLEAARLASAYHQFLMDNGAKNLKPEVTIQGVKMAEIMDTYELIFSHGSFMAGVHQAERRELAENMAGILNQRLIEVTGGP